MALIYLRGDQTALLKVQHVGNTAKRMRRKRQIYGPVLF